MCHFLIAHDEEAQSEGGGGCSPHSFTEAFGTGLAVFLALLTLGRRDRAVVPSLESAHRAEVLPSSETPPEVQLTSLTIASTASPPLLVNVVPLDFLDWAQLVWARGISPSLHLSPGCNSSPR